MDAADRKQLTEYVLNSVFRGLTETDLGFESHETDATPPTAHEVADLHEAARAVLEHTRPLDLVKTELTRLGLGGDTKSALMLYLAGTGRLVLKRRGTIQAHTAIIADASSGKSYLSDITFSLFPLDGVVAYGASSPKVMLYDERPLKHRILKFSEIDSLPGAKQSDEEMTAASAVRELLQSDTLSYDVVVKGADGKMTIDRRRREGPTVLVTTATKGASSEQFDTRLYGLRIELDEEQIGKALKAQADLEQCDVPPEPDPALVAFQAYLQTLAPIDVVVPFLGALFRLVGKARVEPRVLRDAQRLRTLIKAACILNLERRQRNAAGRLVATVDDYETVLQVIEDSFEGTTLGVTAKQRELIETIPETGTVTETDLAALLGVTRQAVGKRLKTVIAKGWVVNLTTTAYAPAALQRGAPLPTKCGLPTVQTLREEWHAEPETAEDGDGGSTP